MRFHTGVALGLMLAAGCSDNGTAPNQKVTQGEGDGRQISGQVVTLTFQPESSYVGVAGVTITVIRTSPDSGDTLAVPPDSLIPLQSRGRYPLEADSVWIDTIPGDTTHSDSTLPPPPDTIPSDTTITPPTGYCGFSGSAVATVVTDASGHFTVSGLNPGVYDLMVGASPGHGGGVYCGVNLQTHESAEVQVYVPTIADSTLHEGWGVD